MTVTTAEAAAIAPTTPLRMAAAGAQALLEQFRDSPLLAQGRINVIGLDAIAQRLGSKWPSRSELVHEHTERALRAQVGSQALVQRISDTEYVVAQPDAPRSVAQLACLNSLRAILIHFLGEAPLGELKLHQVSRIDHGGVYGRPIALAEAEQTEQSERRRLPATTPADAERQRKSLDTWTPFSTTSGLRVALAASLEPVVVLKNGSRLGYRIATRVHHQPSFAALTRREFERLAPADIQRIDLGSIARGLDRMRSLAGSVRPPALILPVSFLTAHSRSGRAGLISLLHRARALVEIGLICEITGVESAPTGALAETIAALRPFVLHAIGRLSDIERDDARHLVGIGLDGVSARCPLFADDTDFSRCAEAFVKANSRVGKALFLHQVQDMFRSRMAGALGVTHVTLAPQRLKVAILDDEPR